MARALQNLGPIGCFGNEWRALPSPRSENQQLAGPTFLLVFKMLTTRQRFAVMSCTHTQVKLKLVTVLEIILLPWNPPSPWEVRLSTSKLPKYLYKLNIKQNPMVTKLVLPLITVFFKKIGNFTENYCIRIYRLNHRWLSEKSSRTFDQNFGDQLFVSLKLDLFESNLRKKIKIKRERQRARTVIFLRTGPRTRTKSVM